MNWESAPDNGYLSSIFNRVSRMDRPAKSGLKAPFRADSMPEL
jgi:hypothetical protein